MNFSGHSVLLYIHILSKINNFIDFYEYYPLTYQWRTFSILFITFLMSSLALLRVSARMDRDIVALLSSSFPVFILAGNGKLLGTYSISFKHFSVSPLIAMKYLLNLKDQKSKL